MVAIEPLAPGMLSEITGCASSRCSTTPAARIDASAGPPAGKATFSKTGLLGYAGDCANTGSARVAPARPAAAEPSNWRRETELMGISNVDRGLMLALIT